MLPESIESLALVLRNFEGIGHRSSQKLALDILQSSEEDFDKLISLINKVRQSIGFCDQCGYFCEIKDRTENQNHLCHICTDKSRNQYQICLVEKPTDIITAERSGIYRGLYFTLEKLISPLDNVFVENTQLPKLLDRLANILKPETPVELILFLKSGFSADTTIAYLKENIQRNGWTDQIKITKLAQGLPLYFNPDTLDQATIAKAMEDRREV